jgi:DNA-directed RNA polymerase omega subunit
LSDTRIAAVQDLDPLQDKFRLIVVTFQRAKQLQNGARPRVDPGDHKFARVAMLEVMAGMVSWSVGP